MAGKKCFEDCTCGRHDNKNYEGKRWNSPRQRKAAHRQGVANRGRVFTPEQRARLGRKRQNDVGYLAAHTRLYRARGKAKDYTCECGKQAAHWAFLWRETPQERWILSNKNNRCIYSLYESDYAPMCGVCASWYDKDERVRAFVFAV